MYKIDNGIYPNTAWSLDIIKNQLLAWWLSDIPVDPNSNNSFDWSLDIEGTQWQYMYIPLNKIWNIAKWFALIAKTETEWWSNRVFDKNYSIETITDTNILKVCDILTQSSYTKNENNWTCYYTNTGDLWYIYKYSE
jgi:hypothetical protein